MAVAATGCGEGSGESSSGAVPGGEDDEDTAGEPRIPAVIELFVDPTRGDDASAGSRKEPFRTLKKALEEARGGQTIWLGAGTYSASSGEDWKVPVAAGVTIAGLVPGQAVLTGTSEDVALQFQGDSALRDVRVEGFGAALVADDGEHVWAGVELTDNVTGIRLGGTAAVKAEGFDIGSQAAGTVSGFELYGVSSLALKNSAIHGLGDDCGNGHAGTVSEAASLEAVALDVHDIDGSLRVGSAAKAFIAGSTFANVGPNGCGNGEAIWLHGAGVLQLHDVAIGGGTRKALLVDDAARVTVVGGIIEVVTGSAVVVRGGAADIEGTAIDAWGNEEPAVAAMAGAMLSIVEATFNGCGRCVLASGGTVSLRGAVFDGAAIAVDVAGGRLDLGNPEEPGGNSFGKVTDTALRVTSTQPMAIPAAGNSWVKGAQGATLGLYPEEAMLEGPLGCEDEPPRNFCLAHAGPVIEL